MTDPAILKMKKFELPKTSLNNALTDLFKVLTAEIHEVMEEVGENKDNYHMFIHPFAIERIDGESVPEHLLLAIQAKLQLDQ